MKLQSKRQTRIQTNPLQRLENLYEFPCVSVYIPKFFLLLKLPHFFLSHSSLHIKNTSSSSYLRNIKKDTNIGSTLSLSLSLSLSQRVALSSNEKEDLKSTCHVVYIYIEWR